MMWSEAGQPAHLTFAGLRGGSKGGSANTSSTSSTDQSGSVTLPSWLSNASQQAVGAASQLQSENYSPQYTGEMVAGPSSDTSQYYNAVQGLQGQGMGGYNAAGNAYQGMLSQLAPQTAGGINQLSNQLYGNYLGGVVNPSAGLLGQYMGGTAGANQIGANQMALMSPYLGAVVNPTLALGQQSLANNLMNIGANANQAGAFGGTRQGVMEGVAQSQAALSGAQYIGNLLSQGYNAAMPVSQALQGQGYGAANTLAGQLQSGYGAAQQAGQGIANQNLAAGLTSAQQLPGLLTSQQNAAVQQAGLLQTAGQQQEAYQQALDDAAYGNWYEAANAPYQNLQTLLSAVSGVPYGYDYTSQGTSTGTSKTTNTPSLASSVGQGVGSVATIAGVAALVA
jgi:hypothetical protein